MAAPPPGSVDLLDKLRFRNNAAVESTLGYCSGQTREGQHRDDVAFRLSKKAVISVPTASAFPGMTVSCENSEYNSLFSCRRFPL